MATGAPGTNGVWQYGEDDSEATFSALLNKAASTTDTQIGADRTRLTNLELAGRIVQTVQGFSSTAVSSSSSTFVDTGVSATITPRSSSNKILVIASHSATQKTNGNAENRAQIRLMRGGTEIASTGNLFLYNASAIHNIGGTVLSILDSPATGSAVTYKTQFASINNTAAVVVNVANSYSSITLLEVKV